MAMAVACCLHASFGCFFSQVRYSLPPNVCAPPKSRSVPSFSTRFFVFHPLLLFSCEGYCLAYHFLFLSLLLLPAGCPYALSLLSHAACKRSLSRGGPFSFRRPSLSLTFSFVLSFGPSRFSNRLSLKRALFMHRILKAHSFCICLGSVASPHPGLL